MRLGFFLMIIQLVFCKTRVLFQNVEKATQFKIQCEWDPSNQAINEADVLLAVLEDKTLQTLQVNPQLQNFCQNGIIFLSNFSHFSPIRIDSKNSLVYDISMKTSPNQANTLLAVVRFFYQFNGQKNLTLIAQQNKDGYNFFCASQELLLTFDELSNNQFSQDLLAEINGYWNYLFPPCLGQNNCSNSLNQLSFHFNLSQISNILIQKLNFNESSYIINISHIIIFSKNEVELNISESIKFTDYLSPTILMVNGLAIYNQPSLSRYWQYSNYSNLTINQNTTTSSFYYKGSEKTNLLEFSKSMKQHITYGYYNGNWTTNSKDVIPLNQKSIYYESIRANFSFNKSFQNQSQSSWSACFSLNFKDDYNPTTHSFVNESNTNFSMQILICTNSKYQQPQMGQFVRKIRINNINYELYVDRSNFNWSVYTFASKENITEFSDFQLREFVQVVSREFPRNDIDSLYLTTLQAGWRFNKGKGYFNLSDISWYLKKKPIFLCLLSVYSLKQQKCVENKTISQALGSLAAVPNLGLIIKINSLITLIDDFSYFVYHQTQYDKAFFFVIHLSWNWTHSKWIPPQFLADIMHISSNPTITQKWIIAAPNSTPIRFRYNNQDIYFLNNCKGYLLYFLPVSLIIFVILWKIYHRFKQIKCASLLKSFSSWVYLVISLVAENAQYLSFRCFQQLNFIAFQNTIQLLSIVVTLLVLYCVVLIAVTLYAFAWTFADQTFKPQILIRHTTTYIVFSTWVISKVIIGFLHAWINDSITCLAIIFVVQLIFMATIFYGGYFSRYKTPYVAFVVYQLFRTVLYFVILLQAIYPQDMIVVSDDNVIISNVTFILVAVIFVMNGIFVILNTAIGLLIEDRETVLPINLKLKKINSQFQLSPLIKNFQHEKTKPMTKLDKFKTQDPTQKPPRSVQSSKKQDFQEPFHLPYFPSSPTNSSSSQSRNFEGINQLPKSKWNKLKKSNKKIKTTRDAGRSMKSLKQTEINQSKRPWK